MTNISDEQVICFCCRNTGCDSYTIYRGFLICEYCLDEWLKDNKLLDYFENWCIDYKKILKKDNKEIQEKDREMKE